MAAIGKACYRNMLFQMALENEIRLGIVDGIAEVLEVGVSSM